MKYSSACADNIVGWMVTYSQFRESQESTLLSVAAIAIFVSSPQVPGSSC
jgi:hypothetical protein